MGLVINLKVEGATLKKFAIAMGPLHGSKVKVAQNKISFIVGNPRVGGFRATSSGVGLMG